MLGHRDIRTTINFYAGMETVAAARRYEAVIDELLSAHGGRRARPGRSPRRMGTDGHREPGRERAGLARAAAAVPCGSRSWPAADRQGWQRRGPRRPAAAGRWAWGGAAPGHAQAPCASYGRWLGFLTRQAGSTRRGARGPRDAGTDPGLCRRAASVNAPGTVLVRLQSLAVVLGWLAPDLDWSWLRPIMLARLARPGPPVRDKDARLRGSDELVALGHRLMARGRAGLAPADGGRRYPVEVKRALRYRDGLMIALLAYHPLRLANLAGLQLGRELRHDGSRLVARARARRTSRTAGPTWCRWRGPDSAARSLPASTGGRRLAGPTAAARHRTALWLSAEGGALGARHAHHRICRPHGDRIRPAGQPASVPRRHGHHDRGAPARLGSASSPRCSAMARSPPPSATTIGPA